MISNAAAGVECRLSSAFEFVGDEELGPVKMKE